MKRRRKVATQYQQPNQDVDGNLMKSGRSTEGARKYWYSPDLDKNTRLEMVQSRASDLRMRSRARREQCRFYAEQYGTAELLGIGLTSYDPMHRGFIAPSLPYNISRRASKTVHAKITKHKPLPMVVGNHADYGQQKMARKLTELIEGGFEMASTFQRGAFAALFAIAIGSGFIQVHHLPGDELPRFTVLLPWEIHVDAADARQGEPKQIVLTRWRDRTELKLEYPEHDAEIDSCSSSSGTIDDNPDYADEADMVLVTEAYRLPVGKGKTRVSGRRSVAIENAMLADGPWDKDHFGGIVPIQYSRPLLGYFGEGVIAEVAGYQYEINYVVETLRMAHRVAGTGIWQVPDNCDVPDTHFENGVGLIMRHRPNFVPNYVNPAPANPQSYQYLEQMTRDSLQYGAGLSTLSTTGQKQPGVTAAKAIQTIQDVEDDGLAVFEDAYEQFYVELADRFLEECRDIANDNGGELRVMAPKNRRRAAAWIEWKDVTSTDWDSIAVETWPTSILGRTPAARLQQVNDLMNAGILDREQYQSLLGAPDVDAESDLMLAMREVADDQIQEVLDVDVKASDAEWNAAYERARPEPYQDLVYSMHRAQQWVCLGKIRRYPERTIQQLRTYIEDAKGELDKIAADKAKKAAAAAAQQQAAMAGTPLPGAPIGPAGMGPAAPSPLMPAPGPMAPPPIAGPPPGAGGPPPPQAPPGVAA